MSERKYLPTLAELIDRLAIVQLKAVYLPGQKDAYNEERKLIEHDIDLLMQTRKFGAEEIRAVLVLMLANNTIWANESKARQGGNEQDKLLKFTHSINGLRAQAKNIIAGNGNERIDIKVDCFAESLISEFGAWDIFK